ncbi:MAG TPA: phosphonate ABC transporter ATP-binding protein [Candidatus Acidoferrales bacterium]|nr:phosphonate ABC transporter ATP-binding protein [Candidatus Acidoferrales bacterium]
MIQYRLERVTKVFPRHQVAIAGLDLEIRQGERIAFIGPSGAGKTTLFRMLNCTLRPSSGKLFIAGEDVDGLHGKRLRQMRRRIGTVYQQHNLIPRLKVVHNVLSGRLGQWSTLQSLISLVRPSDVGLAYDALRRVGIEDKIFARTDELSGGQQQRVAIARVLVQEPEVILADEPVSSVDPSLASVIIKLLLDISDSLRKTLLINLHSVDLALAYFQRVIGIKRGRIVFDLSPDRISDVVLDDLYSGHRPEEQEERLADDRDRPLVYQ